jgi:hypothetical protein
MHQHSLPELPIGGRNSASWLPSTSSSWRSDQTSINDLACPDSAQRNCPPATGPTPARTCRTRRVVAGKCRLGVARSFVGSQRLSVGTGTRICLPSSDGLKPALQLRIAYTKAGN